jgi:hypothetical protein
MTWLHQQIGAEFPRRPASSRLPKYPERRRVYGAVSTAQQNVAGPQIANLLRDAGYNTDTPDEVIQTVEALLAERDVVSQRWRAIRDMLQKYEGWVDTAREQTENGRGGQLGQTVRKLLALIEAIEPQVS